MVKELTYKSQQLRKNMTKEERKLWYEFFRFVKVRTRRQKVIGNYIVDFYISQYKLAIELDGSQHYYEDGLEYDRQRDKYLNSLGIEVMRIGNNEINTNFEGVCDSILAKLGMR